MDLVNASLPWVAGILAVAAFVVVRIGGTDDISQGEPDSVPGWGATYSDDLRGVQADGGFGSGVGDPFVLGFVPEPPAPVIGEPVVQAPDEPAPRPVPAPTAAPVPADEIQGLVLAYFGPANFHKALRVMWCESGGRPWAVSPDNQNRGLFQINQVHAQRFTSYWDAWAWPEYNIQMAHAIWADQGWRPWGCRNA